MNVSGIGFEYWRNITGIDETSSSMPEPEHSDQKGPDAHKWDNNTHVAPVPSLADSAWDAAFKQATGPDYEKAKYFFSREGRKARGKI